MLKPELIDAQEMHRNHPETFEVPSKSELETIQEGTYVKICDGDERFWVQVTKIDGSTIQGTVSNDLVFEKPYNYGDLVEFHQKNVYGILES